MVDHYYLVEYFAFQIAKYITRFGVFCNIDNRTQTLMNTKQDLACFFCFVLFGVVSNVHFCLFVCCLNLFGTRSH